MTEISEDTIKKMEDVATHAPGLLRIYITCEGYGEDGKQKKKKNNNKKLIKFWRGFFCFLIPWLFFVWLITKAGNINSWPVLILEIYAGFGVAWIGDTMKKIFELIFD